MGRDESVDFGLGGWESGQVIAEAADESLRLSRGAPAEFLFGKFGVDEAVDVGVLEILGERLEGPPGLVSPLDLAGGLRPRIGGAHLDPGG